MAKTRSPNIVAIDLGSGSVRAAVFDLKGRCKGFASAPLTPSTPKDTPLGKEFNPTRLWSQVAGLIAASLRKARLSGDDIAAIAATSQREGIAFLDAKGKTLYIGPNSDTRAFFEGQAIDEARREEVYRITGHTPSLLFAPAKLRWFQQQRPVLTKQITTVLSLDAWLAFQLSGMGAMELSSAAELGLLDLSTRSLAQSLLDSLGFPPVTPPLVASGTRIGNVTQAAASATGLKPGTPVIAAGPDTQCGLVGMGVASLGHIGIVAGTTAPIQMVIDKPLVDEKMRAWTGLHLLSNAWVLESNAGDAGTSYSWLVDLLLGGVDDKRYAEADELVKRTPAGSDGAAAFLGPQLADMGNVGPKMGGLLFPIPLSIGGTDRGRLLRTSQENLAFAIRANVEQLAAFSGRTDTPIHIGGGMTRSLQFCRILSAVLNRDISVAQEASVSALGAAICAAVGVGAFHDVRAASIAMASTQRLLKADKLQALEYQDHYERWRSLAKALDGFSGYL